MLIRLFKQEYLPALDALASSDDFLRFVESLATCLVEGWHAVDAAPLLLERFAAWPHLSRRQREALSAAARQMVQRPALYDEVTDCLTITGPAGDSGLTRGHGTRHHRGDWRRFTTLDAFRCCVLAGENVVDARWYAWLARAWSARRQPRSIAAGQELCWESRGIGGSTGQGEVPESLRQGRLVCCILDSDRNHPAADPGETVRGLQKRLRHLPADVPPHHLEVIDARDIENLLPEGIVTEIGEGTEWLAPMRSRGFFVQPDRAVDPDLAYLDIGKHQCQGRLLDTRDAPTRALRERALTKLAQADGTCTLPPACAPTETGALACRARVEKSDPKTGKTEIGWQDIPSDCRVIMSVGKQLLPAAVAHLDGRAAGPIAAGALSVAAWLASLFPPEDPAIWAPARRVWSWGLRLRPRIPSVG